jgi:flagellar biogenesis protein FliO
MPFGFDPVLLVLLGIILLVIFAFYLLIRRTAMAFREGSNRGRR